MSAAYESVLRQEPRVAMRVEFTSEGSEVLDYAVILLVGPRGAMRTIRVYDSAHRYNEMHRYTRGEGKQSGVVFHRGTLGEGMRDAIEAVKNNHREMIEGWDAR